MRVEHLGLVTFRNYQALSMPIKAQVIALEGDNAQGKTNFLEALYLCATGRSFRYATAQQMVAHGSQVARCQALVRRQDVAHEVVVDLKPPQKTIHVDQKALRQSTKLLELLNVVAFFPDDLRIVKDSPEDRRRFLDRSVANCHPQFAAAALAYQQALRSRNALLRQSNRVDRQLLMVFDKLLVQHGQIIHEGRFHVLQTLQPLAQHYFNTMMPGNMQLQFHLKSGIPKTESCVADIQEVFLQALQASYPQDMARGMTSVGPHRADLLFSIDGFDAKYLASQGQQRTVVLALKLAEVESLQARLGRSPILLLDDISSELDKHRSRMLFEMLEGMQSQIFISTTGATSLPLPAHTQRFCVQQGHLIAMN